MPSKVPARGRKATAKNVQPVSHLFQIQLFDQRLSADQVARVADKIRAVTAKELLKMDFRVDEISPLFLPEDIAGNCGGGCNSCNS